MIQIFSAIFFCLFLFMAPQSQGADIRKNAMEAEKNIQKTRETLLKKAILEKKTSVKEAENSLKKILSSRKNLTDAIAKIKEENKNLEKENNGLQKQNIALKKLEDEVISKLASMDAMVNELTGLTVIAAKDIDSLLARSIHSALFPERFEKIKPLLNKTKFPGMDDIKSMVDIYFDEIKKSGEVSINKGIIVDRSGNEVDAHILAIGSFTAAYRIKNSEKDETGFLLFSDKSNRLFALSKPPPGSVSKKIKKYMTGKSIAVPMDIARGAALRQLTHTTSLRDQILNGGPIVWPILGVGFIAFLIIIERFIFLQKVDTNADKMMTTVNRLATEEKWDECLKICEKQKERPVPHVLLSGINAREKSREDMENILQEAILHEIPRIEARLSSLGILAAISPLLGLLGTVTGMINTFHAITFYGTGDPRMMSGGISEALTTTMLGLGVAIPIMLFHTFLSRKVENIISHMEEKAVSLANIVFKEK